MTEPVSTPLLSPDVLIAGAVLVHRHTGYLFRLDPASVDATTLRFTGVGEHRMLQLSREEARAQLRAPIDTAAAETLERVIASEAAVVPTPDLDLALHLLGAPEQVAAAIGTLIDRAAEGSERSRAGAASDLRFQHLKLIGELAWVTRRPTDLFGRSESPALHAYEAELRTKRSAVPVRDRRTTVAAPHVPVVPTAVIDDARAHQNGWHALSTRLRPGPRLVAASLGYHRLEVHEELGATGELFVSTMHGGGGIDWIVLSESAPATLASDPGALRATLDGDTFALTPGPMRPGEVLVVVHEDHPSDLLASIDLRLSHPRAQVLVWPFGLAACPGMDGWSAFIGRSPRGHGVWAFACGEGGT